MSRRCGMTASRTAGSVAPSAGWLSAQRQRYIRAHAASAPVAPYERGDLRLPHRIAMAPLTRNRARATIPGELNDLLRAARQRGDPDHGVRAAGDAKLV